jgi:hypothetical protein
MKLLGTITCYNQKVFLYVTTYVDGRLAIVGTLEDGEPFATLTVNLPEEALEPGQFFAKTWSENEEFASICLASGLFTDTGVRAITGFVLAEVWALSNVNTKGE